MASPPNETRERDGICRLQARYNRVQLILHCGSAFGRKYLSL